MSDLLTEQETADYLRVSIYSVKRWRRVGTGPPYTKLGLKTIRYHKSDIDGWLIKFTSTKESNLYKGPTYDND